MKYIDNNGNKQCIDCFDRIHTHNKKFIPQIFNSNYIFISIDSFQQNHIILGVYIRRYVDSLINNKEITCIGGESYIYGLIKCDKIYHYTNNKSIYDDCEYNNKFYKKNIINNIITNYNDFNYDIYTNICLINISKLTLSLLTSLINQNINKIIIINCNHKDFWNKIKILLINYKLIRKKFICYKLKYFITVNVFIKKNTFISLGNNCSIAYQLNKLKLRNIAYPFDWSNIKYNQLISVLKNNFEDYENIEIKKYSNQHFSINTNSDSSYILHNKYNITFAHEVLNINEINNFKSKLKRRILRFKNLSGYITFIRIEQKNINNYDNLINILDKYILNYKLIIISNNIIHHPKIINYKLPTFIDWKYNNINFNTILLNTLYMD